MLETRFMSFNFLIEVLSGLSGLHSFATVLLMSSQYGIKESMKQWCANSGFRFEFRFKALCAGPVEMFSPLSQRVGDIALFGRVHMVLSTEERKKGK